MVEMTIVGMNRNRNDIFGEPGNRNLGAKREEVLGRKRHQ